MNKLLFRSEHRTDVPIIEGYMAIWGTPQRKDCYDTWFDRDKPPTMHLDTVPFVLLYNHNLSQDLARVRLGTVYEAWLDDLGIGYHAYLDHYDESDSLHRTAYRELNDGKLYTSSGSAPHLARFDDEGRFVDWGLAEVSLTDSPCEPRMIAVSLINNELPSQLVNPPLESAEVLTARATPETLPSEGQPCSCSQRTWDDLIREVKHHAIEHHKRGFATLK